MPPHYLGGQFIGVLNLDLLVQCSAARCIACSACGQFVSGHIWEVIYASNSKGKSGGGDLKYKSWLYTSAVHLGTSEFVVAKVGLKHCLMQRHHTAFVYI